MNFKPLPLHRYWIKFERRSPGDYLSCGVGYGVTAYTYEDALNILQKRVFEGDPLPPIASVVEDVDVSELDRNHIRPNMGVPVWRGVWFPLGYQDWD